MQQKIWTCMCEIGPRCSTAMHAYDALYCRCSLLCYDDIYHSRLKHNSYTYEFLYQQESTRLNTVPASYVYYFSLQACRQTILKRGVTYV